MSKQNICRVCGGEITPHPEDVNGLCNVFHCGHCPYAKVRSPCPKEQKSGTLVEQLAKWQSKS